MKSRVLAVTSVVALVFAATLYAGDVKLEGIKCLVNSKKAANASKSADYKKGKVYFCCGGCASKFAKSKDNFAAKANQQLVSTKQYKQAKCPLSGGKCDATKTCKVGAVKVAFCCGKCQGNVAKAKGDKQAELVFSDKAFDKGFVVAAKKASK